MALITKLDAVNRVLVNSGLSPVISLDDEGSADSRIAELMLDDALLDAQLQGLAVSSYAKQYTPDATTGEIPLAGDISQVSLYTALYTDDELDTRLIQIAQRNDKLFNVSEQTFDWSRFDTVTLEVEEVLPWEDLPVQNQREIIAVAALRYQLQQSGDQRVAQQLAQEQQYYRATARANDIGRRNVSIFSANTSARGAVSRERNGWGSPNNRYPSF